MKKHFYKLSKHLRVDKNIVPAAIVIVVAVLGVIFLEASHAASPYVSSEAESGTLAGSATKVTDSNASGGSAVQFGSASSGGGGNCTNPVWSTSDAEGTESVGGQTYWMDNDAWNGSHGPQTLYVCTTSSWYAVSNQPNNGGAVETYPNTEYDVGGRGTPSTKTISQYNSITSTFAENFPSAGSWDAAYDMWFNQWQDEVMVWNEDAGSQTFWDTQGTSVTVGGVAYQWAYNGGVGSEQIFIMKNKVKSGSADLLAVFKYLVTQGILKSTDVPTQLEYGVEVCSTSGTETFPVTGLTFTLN